MGLFDKMLGKQTTAKPKVKIEPTTEELETLDKLLALMESKAKECIKYTIVEQDTGLYDSKLGGPYYLPEGMNIPEVNGIKLSLLAQINLGQQPAIPGFPNKGLVQFFIADDGYYGLSPGGEDRNRAAVRYIEDVPADENVKIVDERPEDFPFDTSLSLALVGTTSRSIPSPLSNDYVDILKELVPELLCEKAWGTGFISDYLNEEFHTQFIKIPDVEVSGTLLGGYPDFAQDEVRKPGEYDTMLFQLDSDMDYVCWGDCGIANFFISNEDLAKLNFTDILYNWDCG